MTRCRRSGSGHALRLSSSENFKYAWLDLASLIAPFVIDSAAIRPATNDPICSPPPAAVRRSKLICAGDKLSRTPRPAPPSKATLCCCRRNRDPCRRAPADTRCRAARISPGSFERSAYRPTGLSPKSSSFDNRRNYCEHGTERAELPQAVQRLIFGIQYRKDGIKAHDVKDLLDRFLYRAKDNFTPRGS